MKTQIKAGRGGSHLERLKERSEADVGRGERRAEAGADGEGVEGLGPACGAAPAGEDGEEAEVGEGYGGGGYEAVAVGSGRW